PLALRNVVPYSNFDAFALGSPQAPRLTWQVACYPKSGRRTRAKVAKTAKGGTYGKGRNHRVGDPFNVSPTS
ncbi:MAG: hypothetical protein WCP06_00415, partial [Verrucomicrobiota bacterium]